MNLAYFTVTSNKKVCVLVCRENFASSLNVLKSLNEVSVSEAL